MGIGASASGSLLSAKRECCSREKEAPVLPNVFGRKNVKLYFNVEQ